MSHLKSGPEFAEAALRDALIAASAVISRRRPDLVNREACGWLIERGWLEWFAGSLRLTPAGVQTRDAALLGPDGARPMAWVRPTSSRRYV